MLTPSDITLRYSRMQLATSAPRILSMLHSRCATLIKQSLKNETADRKLLVNAQNILAQLESALIIDDDLSKSFFISTIIAIADLRAALRMISVGY